MNAITTEFKGLFVLQPRIFEDGRGSFVKTYNDKIFSDLGIRFQPKEEFFSVSYKEVIRGMHFQLPPSSHQKLVYCIAGKVLDVVVDLRTQSETLGKCFSRELDEKKREQVFIPIGFAHGFLTLSETATVVYQTDTGHSSQHDTGVRWDSINFSWPTEAPIVSVRDSNLPQLKDFQSPF